MMNQQFRKMLETRGYCRQQIAGKKLVKAIERFGRTARNTTPNRIPPHSTSPPAPIQIRHILKTPLIIHHLLTKPHITRLITDYPRPHPHARPRQEIRASHLHTPSFGDASLALNPFLHPQRLPKRLTEHVVVEAWHSRKGVPRRHWAG
jgi:hypothetical protein